MSAEEFTYLPVHVYIMPSPIYENFSWWGTELSILLGKKIAYQMPLPLTRIKYPDKISYSLIKFT